MKIHETYIKRCIQLAKNGLILARPNPSVGAVIVYKQKIIGEGYTSPYGGPHAEVNAIRSVTEEALLPQATLYVSLEPCNHHGKTPPCVDLILEKGIRRVVIGTVDPHNKVAGSGIKKLMEAGCDVTVGILETACRDSNIRFFTYHQRQRPYIILKWAQTLDGFIAPQQRDIQEPVWITGTLSRKRVHQWRSEEQAILVGAQTVLDDNPELTTRDWEGASPLRIVIDRNESLPKTAKVFNTAAKTLVLHQTTAQDIARALYDQGIQSVIVEGGARTLARFIEANLWDEVRVFYGNTRFGKGTAAPMLPKDVAFIHREHIGTDLLHYYKNDSL